MLPVFMAQLLAYVQMYDAKHVNYPHVDSHSYMNKDVVILEVSHMFLRSVHV